MVLEYYFLPVTTLMPTRIVYELMVHSLLYRGEHCSCSTGLEAVNDSISEAIPTKTDRTGKASRWVCAAILFRMLRYSNPRRAFLKCPSDVRNLEILVCTNTGFAVETIWDKLVMFGFQGYSDHPVLRTTRLHYRKISLKFMAKSNIA